MNLKRFFKECHKKEVFKMLSIYIVSSWIILQVLALISEPIGAPKKSVTYLIIILLIGFPIYVYYIWKFKLLKHEIQRTEDPSTPYNKSAFQRMYFSSLFVITLLSGISITLILKNNFSSSFSLEEIRSNNKIAVLEFENTTSNEELTNVGKIASSWIIHGITEHQLGQVISQKLVNDYISILKTKEGPEDLNNILKNYFKPDKVIEGVYYEENGKLLLQGSILDGLMDKTLMSFETIICDPDSPLDCAENLKQQILGYLSTVAKQDDLGYIIDEDTERVSSYYEETPPIYEAYQYLLNALDNVDNSEIHIDLLNKSIEIDNNFFEPKIHLISYYYNEGAYEIADSLHKDITLYSKLNDRQRNWMIFYEAILNGKNDKVYRAIKEEYSKAYKDISTNMTAMTIALQFVNRPEDIDSIYREISMENLSLENCSRCGFRYYLKGLADVELGNYDEVIQTVLPITNIIEENYLKRPLIMAYVKTDKTLELEKYLSEYALINSKNNLAYLYNFSGIQFKNNNQNDLANNYFNKVIADRQSITDSINLAEAYYFVEDYENARVLYTELLEQNKDNFDYITRLAVSNYKIGNKKEAIRNLNELDNLRGDYDFGAVDYGIAQYYAVIGNDKKALEYLLKAVAKGYNFTPNSFQNDPHFISIKDRPKFKNRVMNYWKNKIL